MSITFDVDFQNSDDIWTSTAETTHPGNGGVVRRIVNSITTTQKFDAISDGASAAYRTPSAGALQLPNIDLDGYDDYYAGPKLNNFITASEFDVLVAFSADVINSTNHANPWENTGILIDSYGYFGLYLKNGFLLGYNWDSNSDTISIALSTSTAYVVRFRHSGGNIYMSINGGSESSVASGDTGDIISGYVRIGNNYLNRFFNGQIGRIVIANTGDELGTLYATMVTDWVTGAAGGHPTRKRFGGIPFNGYTRRGVW